MSETWNVWVTKDRKVLLTNIDAPVAEGEGIAIDKNYFEAKKIAEKVSAERSLEVEIEDMYECKECGCYDGWHADNTECHCSCCCSPEDEEDLLEEWEDC